MTEIKPTKRIIKRRKKKQSQTHIERLDCYRGKLVLPVSSVANYVRRYFNAEIKQLKSLIRKYPDETELRANMTPELTAFVTSKIAQIIESKNRQLWKKHVAQNPTIKTQWLAVMQNKRPAIQCTLAAMRKQADPKWVDVTEANWAQKLTYPEKLNVICNKYLYRVGAQSITHLTIFLQILVHKLISETFFATSKQDISVMKKRHFTSAISSLDNPLRTYFMSMPTINRVMMDETYEKHPSADKFINYVNRVFKQMKPSGIKGSSSREFKQICANTICETIQKMCSELESYLTISNAKTIKDTFVTEACFRSARDIGLDVDKMHAWYNELQNA